VTLEEIKIVEGDLNVKSERVKAGAA